MIKRTACKKDLRHCRPILAHEQSNGVTKSAVKMRRILLAKAGTFAGAAGISLFLGLHFWRMKRAKEQSAVSGLT